LTKEKDVNYEPEFCLKMPILHAPESKQSKYETRIANKKPISKLGPINHFYQIKIPTIKLPLILKIPIGPITK